MFQGEREGGLIRQPVGPSVDIAIMTTVLSTNSVDSRRFSSRGCAFRRTHMNKDPIRLLCIQLALPSALSLPSRFAPCSKLKVRVSPRALWLAGFFLCGCTFWDYRGEGLTRQPMGPSVKAAAITAATSINHVDSGSFSSRCCTFRRTHTSADPIRMLCIRLALTLTLSRSSQFVPSARLMIGASPRALWLVGNFSCNCMFWDDWGGELIGQQPIGPQVETANIRTVLNTNRVDSRSFGSKCWAFRRTHSSAGPILLLYFRLALPLTLSLPSRFAPSARLTVGGTPCALWLGGDFSCNCIFWEKKGG